MKKRNLLLIFGLVAMLALTGCSGSGSDNDGDNDKKEKEEEEVTLEGEWSGAWDLSGLMMDSLEGSGMEDYADFTGLEIVLDFEFEKDGDFTLSIEDDSIADFEATMKDALIDMLDTYMEEMASSYGYTVDELYELMEMTRDDMVASFLEQMDFDTLMDEMFVDLETSGTYEYDDETITVTYDDTEDEEEWEYKLDGDTLELTIEADDFTVELECERQ